MHPDEDTVDDDSQGDSLREPILTAQQAITEKTMETLEKIDEAMPMVKGLEMSDAELDELGDLAKEAFNTLLDLGMQVDSRFSAEIFNSASSFLGHAITTKTAKVNKKLKMIDLQLKQATLEQKRASQVKEIESLPTGTGTKMNRTDLLKTLLENRSVVINNS